MSVISSALRSKTLEVAAEIAVPTATAIVYNPDNPYSVLVGKSDKHVGRVLPGGKIDLKDQKSSCDKDTAKNCIQRELEEEVGAQVLGAKFLFIHSNPQADVRLVKAEVLRGTLKSNEIAKLDDQADILARHGVPDYIFAVAIDPCSVVESAELKELEWIDCRSEKIRALGSDHTAVLKYYSQLIGCR